MNLATLFVLGVFMNPANALDIHGHRGARWSRPENTIPAFIFAVENGASTLELDMHVTSDGVIVITHDPFLNPKLCVDKDGKAISGDLLVHKMTLAQLQTYDCGRLKNPKFPTQQPVPKTPIPTLDSLFTWIEKSKMPAAKKVRFNIETKSEEDHPEYTPQPDKFVRMFLEVVKKHKMMNRVILQSFDYRTLKIARKLEPKLPLSVLVEYRPGPAAALVKLMRDNDAQILSPDYSWLTDEDIKAIHELKAQVIPWTVDDENDWKRLIKFGVDGIITDNPKGLADYLKKTI
jgi:glycerophosphoryl diester phosphodiesterase